jgi:hypothetical protein
MLFDILCGKVHPFVVFVIIMAMVFGALHYSGYCTIQMILAAF